VQDQLEMAAILAGSLGLREWWASERTLEKCQEVLQEVLEERLVLKIRDHDPIPRVGRVTLPLRVA
jgi:hypothetical protein